MKIVALNMKMMRTPDRDGTYSIKAHAAIQRFLALFPDNDYVPMAKQYLKEVEENLAQKDFGVGMFYAEKGNYVGAKSRFKEITEQYPDYSAMDETLFRLAEANEKTQNPDEASIYYQQLAKGFRSARGSPTPRLASRSWESPFQRSIRSLRRRTRAT